MTPDSIVWIQNAMTASGILVLSVPAFSLNHRKKALSRIVKLVRNRRQHGDTSALDAIADELRTEREQQVGRWYRLDEVCLLLGYVLLLGAAVWRLFG